MQIFWLFYLATVLATFSKIWAIFNPNLLVTLMQPQTYKVLICFKDCFGETGRLTESGPPVHFNFRAPVLEIERLAGKVIQLFDGGTRISWRVFQKFRLLKILGRVKPTSLITMAK
jgi:hypothetical protein